MTKALSVVEQKVTTIRTLLAKQSGQIESALPIKLNVERFNRIVVTSIQRTPKLLDCTPQSLLAAVMLSAQLGLEPDGLRNMAHLIPYGNKVQFIAGYMGLCDLALRSGKIRKIVPRIVYENDQFSFSYGVSENLVHNPELDTVKRGKPIAAYAVAWFREVNDYQFEVMDLDEIESIRNRSMASRSGPWVTDWNAMAKKTVLRQLCKYLPSTTVVPQLAMAVGLDEAADRGEQDVIDLDTGEIIEPVITPSTGLDALADQHGAPPEKAEVVTPELPEPKAPEIKPLSQEEKNFIDSFRMLRKKGIALFWLEHHNYIMSFPANHPIRFHFMAKHTRLIGEPQLPSFASPAPSGPATMPDAPEQPPEEPEPYPPTEQPEPWPNEIEPDHPAALGMGEGVEEPGELFPEEPTPEQLDKLVSQEESEAFEAGIQEDGHNVHEFRAFAKEHGSYEFNRYTKHFHETASGNLASCYSSFVSWRTKSKT
jgi:recombination protein RecT